MTVFQAVYTNFRLIRPSGAMIISKIISPAAGYLMA
jgi:hypothetical protein